VFQRFPQLRVTILGELAQSHPATLSGATHLVDRKDFVLVLAEFDGELPALDLEHDPQDLDPLLPACGDELRIVHEAIEPRAGIDRTESLLLEVRERDRSPTEGRPDQHRCAVLDQIVDHGQSTRRQAWVIAVLSREPGIEVHAPLHARSSIHGHVLSGPSVGGRPANLQVGQ
jgi:hypothetical protein